MSAASSNVSESVLLASRVSPEHSSSKVWVLLSFVAGCARSSREEDSKRRCALHGMYTCK